MSQEVQRLALLKLLEQNPCLSQRKLAQAWGVILGKTNYCPKALKPCAVTCMTQS